MDNDVKNIRRLDPGLLLVFRELIRHRRTTLAADKLRLSQSAVSHALARLREILGDPLFLRLPHGLQPTHRALELAPKIEALLALAADVVGSQAVFEPAKSDRLFRIAGNDLVCALIAAPLIVDLAHEAPQASVTFRALIGEAAFAALREDTIDLALGRITSLPDDFDAVPLFDENFVVVARRRHPIVRGPVDLETYLACDHLLVSFIGRLTGMVDFALKRQGLARRVVASVPMFLAAFSAVAASDLVATVPERLAAKHAAAFGLVVRPPPLAIEPFTVTAVRHARSKGDHGLDWLCSRISRIVENEL